MQTLHRATRGGRVQGGRRTSSHRRYTRLGDNQKVPIVILNIGPTFVFEQAPLSSRGVAGAVPPIRYADDKVESPLYEVFRKHVDKWKNDTMHWSSMLRITSHPSYLRIIGLAGELGRNELGRLILRELETEPYHWFDALEAISGKNPVKPEDNFDAAVNAWLEWGRKEGIIANDNATRA